MSCLVCVTVTKSDNYQPTPHTKLNTVGIQFCNWAGGMSLLYVFIPVFKCVDWAGCSPSRVFPAECLWALRKLDKIKRFFTHKNYYKMSPISFAIRQDVATRLNGGQTPSSIATVLVLGVKTVYRLMRQFRQPDGTFEAVEASRATKQAFSREQLVEISQWLLEAPQNSQ